MKARIAVLVAALMTMATVAVGASAAPTQRSAEQATIVGVAAGDKRFSTLVSLVKKAGLVKTLNGTRPYTVFAPTNAAFAALKKNAPATYKAVVADKKLLTKVLTYHVLAGRVDSKAAIAAAKKSASVKTVQGERIKLSLRGERLFLNGSSRVVIADVKASNGIVHAVNAVLVPPTLASATRPAAPSPTIVEKAIEVNASGPYAGSFDVLLCLATEYPDIVSTLSQRGQYTVFAPTDGAFGELGLTADNCKAYQDANAAAVKNILLYHVAVGRRDAAQVIASTEIRMLNGQFAAVAGATIDGQNIIVTDVAATNGIIHAVDGVLVP